MQLKIDPIKFLEFDAARVAGGRFRGPSELKVHVLDLPYDLKLTIAFQHERYVCTAIAATQRKGGDPLSSADLRSIPITTIIQLSLEGLVEPVQVEATATPGTVKISPRRRRPGDDVDVAATIYGVAQACGKQPMKAVSDRLGVPLGTARRLIAQARELDYLGPAP